MRMTSRLIKTIFMGELWNNLQIEVFLANWEVAFFESFLSVIYSMYVIEGMCMIGHPGNLLWEGGAGYFMHNDGHITPRNDVLIVSSLPPD